MREVDRRDGPYLAEGRVKFDASFILGGQIAGEPCKLFRIYAEGNFIEAGEHTIYLQTGETKYGKPILERVLQPATPLKDAAKCVLVSFDSTMRANLSVGMPIDLLVYARDSLRITMKRRFAPGDPYFTSLHDQWSRSLLDVFRQLPDLTFREGSGEHDVVGVTAPPAAGPT